MLPLQPTSLQSTAPSPQSSRSPEKTPSEDGTFEDAVTTDRLANQEQKADVAKDAKPEKDAAPENDTLPENEPRAEKEPNAERNGTEPLDVKASSEIPEPKAKTEIVFAEPQAKVAANYVTEGQKLPEQGAAEAEVEVSLPKEGKSVAKTAGDSETELMVTAKADATKNSAIPQYLSAQPGSVSAGNGQIEQVKPPQNGVGQTAVAAKDFSADGGEPLEELSLVNTVPAKARPTEPMPQTLVQAAPVPVGPGVKKGHLPAAPTHKSVDFDGMDVEIRTLTAPEPVAPKAPTHPLQSILHAQMPEQLRKAAQSKNLDFSTEIKALKSDSFGLEVGDLRVNTPLGPTLAPRGDMQVAVPRQLAEAVRVAQAGDKMIEVALSPSELGRVRMMLSPAEAGLTINITAERSETLELLRRNIQELRQSFEDMGYEDISFAFGQEQADPRDGFERNETADEATQAPLGAPIEHSVSPMPMQPLAHASSGIDIRV